MMGFVRPFLLLFGLIYFGIAFLVLGKVVHLVLPKRVKDKYRTSMIVFHVLILVCCVLVLCGKYVIGQHYMAGMASSIRMTVKLALLLYTCFVGWNLLNNPKSRITIISISAYVLFILVGFIITPPAKSEHSEIDAANKALKQVGTLGYVKWIPVGEDANKVSVVEHNPELAYQGYNLYAVHETAQAILIDMDGKEVHRWDLDKEHKYGNVWVQAELCENGDVLSYGQDHAVLRVGPKSELRWATKVRAHHYMNVASDGTISVVTRKDAIVKMWDFVPVPMLNDMVTVMSQDGKILDEISLTLPARQIIPAKTIGKIYRHVLHPKKLGKIIKSALFDRCIFHSSTLFDVLHTNSVGFLENNIEGVSPKGNFLVSLRDLNTIGILDVDTHTYVWTWGPGDILGQHCANILENDNILLFDNGFTRDYSRVIEINPATNRIEWEYKADPPENLYSGRRGGCQRLPNGNTLIMETERGLIFEVTKDGKIVWKFYYPDISDDRLTRKAIRYMHRIPPGHKGLVFHDYLD
jgi:hypothetical protein